MEALNKRNTAQSQARFSKPEMRNASVSTTPFTSRGLYHIFPARMSIVINILLVIHVIISILIILFVLMQRPKSEGLGAAFGGGMTENLFGAQTTNVLSTITRWLAGIFFALTLTLSVLYAKQSTTKSTIQKQLIETAKPVTSVTSVKDDALQKQISDTLKEAASPQPSAASAPVPVPAAPVDDKAPALVAPVQQTAAPAPEATRAAAETPKAAKPSPAKSKHAKP